MMEITVGIDFGTSNSCISTVIHNMATTLSQKSSSLSPSFVSFKGGSDTVKNNTQNNLINTIYASKRLIGRKFSDKEVQEDIPFLDYAVEEDYDGEVVVKIDDEIYSPVEIASYIIKELKERVESRFKNVENAVMCVPAYFNDKQRNDLVKAAELAGFKVLKIINEPIAAAIAYSFNRRRIFSNNNDNVNVGCVYSGNNRIINNYLLVYDLGSRTFDVSIIELSDNNNNNNNEITIKGTSSDIHLGGEDFTNILFNYLLSKYNKKREEILSYSNNSNNNYENSNNYYEDIIKEYPVLNKIQQSKLKQNCEIGKISLSKMKEVKIEVTENYSETITLSEYSSIIKPLLDNTIEITNKTIEKSEISKESISNIILIGGSTRMPQITEYIKNEFPKAKICENINPDEALSQGAAIVANDLMYYNIAVIKNNNDIIEIVNNNCIPEGSAVLINYKSGEGIKDNFVVKSSIDNSYHLKSSVEVGDNIVLLPLNQRSDMSDTVLHNIGVEIIEKTTLRGIMDVVANINEKIPFLCKKKYKTTEDNQEFVKIKIFEGENKYTEDNRLIGVFEVGPIPKLPKGEYRFYVLYKIDKNGILKLTATNMKGYPLSNTRIRIK